MASKNLHDKPFDEATITKLDIFEDYAQAWIPTFVMQGTPTICIFDFFAGTGYDINNVAGSPIRILQKIKEQIGAIFQKQVKVKVYLNEFEPEKVSQPKFQLLQTACDSYLLANPDVKRAVEIKYFNEDFSTLFPKLLAEIRKCPSLVYLDQNGVKFLSEKYLLDLEQSEQTDFLYFVSSSYLWRFENSPELKLYMEIDLEAAKKEPYNQIHRSIIKLLREKLPHNTKLKLYPFSIKKRTNIYGIIFGASHPRAVDKFLTIAWNKNSVNGQANFDIDDDLQKSQTNMFEDKKPTKIESFKADLKEKILSGQITTNFETLLFVYEEGHIGRHAADCIREMKKMKEVDYEGPSPLITYENVFKNKKKLEFKILKNEKQQNRVDRINLEPLHRL